MRHDTFLFRLDVKLNCEMPWKGTQGLQFAVPVSGRPEILFDKEHLEGLRNLSLRYKRADTPVQAVAKKHIVGRRPIWIESSWPRNTAVVEHRGFFSGEDLGSFLDRRIARRSGGNSVVARAYSKGPGIERHEPHGLKETALEPFVIAGNGSLFCRFHELRPAQ